MTKGFRRDIISINLRCDCSHLETYIDSICAVCSNQYSFNGDMVANMTQKMEPGELNRHLEKLSDHQLIQVLSKAIHMAGEDIERCKQENRALRIQVECLVADAKHVADKGWHPSLTKHPHPGIH